MIYFVSCSQCIVQYVGQATLPFHKRINVQKRAKYGCQHVKHFKDVFTSASFSVQIIEVFSGSGYKNKLTVKLGQIEKTTG